jgi:hypothetical protein
VAVDDWLSGLPFLTLLFSLAAMLGVRVCRVVGRVSTQIDTLPSSIQSLAFAATLRLMVVITLSVYVVYVMLG